MAKPNWLEMFAPVSHHNGEENEKPIGPFADIRAELHDKLDELIEAVNDVEDGIDNLAETSIRRRLINSIQASTDTAQVILNIPPSNGSWEIERINTVVTNADGTAPGTVGIAFYLDAIQPTGLLHIINDAAMFSSEQTNIYVPKGTNEIVVAINGLGAINTNCSIILQIKAMPEIPFEVPEVINP